MAMMTKCRRVGDAVRVAAELGGGPYMIPDVEANREPFTIEGCPGCPSPFCREWAVLWGLDGDGRPDPRRTLRHVSECQMEDLRAMPKTTTDTAPSPGAFPSGATTALYQIRGPDLAELDGIVARVWRDSQGMVWGREQYLRLTAILADVRGGYGAPAPGKAGD